MLNNKSGYLSTYFSRDFEDIMSKYHMNEIKDSYVSSKNIILSIQMRTLLILKFEWRQY